MSLTQLPPSHFACQWCSGGVRWLKGEGGTKVAPEQCPHCSLRSPSPGTAPVAPVATAATARQARARRGPVRTAPFSEHATGIPALGVDPGARNVGLCLRHGEVVLYAETFVRPDAITEPLDWARRVVAHVRHVIDTVCPDGTVIGIESITAPKGFKDGQRASLDPKAIVFTAAVAGGLATALPEAVLIAPGGNGSQDESQYPRALVGRRPKDLPGSRYGASTRAHEQSAFDVAGKALAAANRPAA